jgi:methenyltetrahydromethanopterin cyclohydrolase
MQYLLNQRALDVLAAGGQALESVARREIAGGTCLDFGIEAPGSLEAGRLLAEVCLGGWGEVRLAPPRRETPGERTIVVESLQPIAACMASQYAGWQVSVGDFFAMGSGPMRAHYGKEPLFETLPGKETAPMAVGVLETRKVPDDKVILHLSEKLNLPPDKITLLVAPAASLAGNVQIVARSVETALHKLHHLKFNMKQVVAGFGTAPLPPVSIGDVQAFGRTNDAILYGARVTLWVQADDAQLQEIGPKVPSCSSKDHGAPFAEIFARYNSDFYKIDPALFSPAQVVFHNVRSGKTHGFGRLEPELLMRSFFL